MPTGIYVRTKPNSGQFKKGQESWIKGKKWSEESKRKMSESHIGLKVSEKTREKMRTRMIGWNPSEEIRKRIRENRKGKCIGKIHPKWKGEKVGYDALHDWIKRKKGKAKQCVHCGTKDAKRYEWSNIDHKYRRNVDDFIELCTKCHYKYHQDNNLRIHYGFIKQSLSKI